MRSTRTVQVVIVLLISGLIAFIYFSARNTSTALDKKESGHKNSEEASAQRTDQPFDFDQYAKIVKNEVPKKDLETINILEQNYKTQPSREAMQHLADAYDKIGYPAMAGYYYLQLAQSKKDDAKAWALAGRKFYEAEGMFAGTASFYSLITESMGAYDKAIELNPRDLDAKADQAANIMDLGQGPPMKAVGMLRDILQTDSNNRKALLYLGIFSVRSAQFDKAIKRFQRLTELDPADAEYHRYLGDTYIKSGNNELGIKELEKYRDLIKDPEAKAEVEKMIKDLKNGTPVSK